MHTSSGKMKCSKCGTENPENAVYCQECGDNLKREYPENANKYNTATGLGLIGIFFGLILSPLFLILGIVCGIYLWTRPDVFAKQRAKYIIMAFVIIFLTYIIIVILFNTLI